MSLFKSRTALTNTHIKPCLRLTTVTITFERIYLVEYILITRVHKSVWHISIVLNVSDNCLLYSTLQDISLFYSILYDKITLLLYDHFI